MNITLGFRTEIFILPQDQVHVAASGNTWQNALLIWETGCEINLAKGTNEKMHTMTYWSFKTHLLNTSEEGYYFLSKKNYLIELAGMFFP